MSGIYILLLRKVTNGYSGNKVRQIPKLASSVVLSNPGTAIICKSILQLYLNIENSDSTAPNFSHHFFQSKDPSLTSGFLDIENRFICSRCRFLMDSTVWISKMDLSLSREMWFTSRATLMTLNHTATIMQHSTIPTSPNIFRSRREVFELVDSYVGEGAPISSMKVQTSLSRIWEKILRHRKVLLNEYLHTLFLASNMSISAVAPSRCKPQRPWQARSEDPFMCLKKARSVVSP